MAKIEYNGEKMEIKMTDLFEKAKRDQHLEQDLVNLTILNEPEILWCLAKRFEDDDIYTYIGPTLLVINPFMLIQKLYEPSNLYLYQKQVSNPTFTLKDHPPHGFATTAMAVKNLFDRGKKQAIVISGESGAGKTESTKHCMKFIASFGNIQEDPLERKNLLNPAPKKRLSIVKTPIEDKILACNPILESFGNAKTTRNDNSSRFGKYMVLYVRKEGKRVEGANIITYLLEKSRVNTQSLNERNYHIFYHLLSGANEQQLKEMGLVNKPEIYNYLKKSECFVVPKIPDKELYEEILVSMVSLEFSPDQKDAVWTIVAAVLLLGQIEFVEDKDPSKFYLIFRQALWN